MWFIYLTNGFQSKVTWTLQPFAVSDWESHSLIPVIGVIASCANAAVFIPLSKILDLWGRAEGFLLMVVLATVGMAVMAGSHSLPTYCAAYVSQFVSNDSSRWLIGAGIVASRLVRFDL